MAKSIARFLVLSIITCGLLSCASAQDKPDIFGIYVSRLDGGGFKQILSDPYREMNHVRVSPDGKRITYSLFNDKKLISGLAEEDNGYLNTQIVIADIDGTGATSLTPEGKYEINVNSYWTPDGQGLVYMSNNNEDKRTLSLKYLDLGTRKENTISTPGLAWVFDPFMVGGKLVFPAADRMEDTRAIWMLDLETGAVKQVTVPRISTKGKKVANPPPGDSDPKFSPDGARLAFTRHHGDLSFENIILDLSTGRETSISEPGVVDVMPEWSSDGKLLTFWHVDMKDFSKIGIYTVEASGKNRKKIPLPPGYHFKMPAFFPNDGSGPDARIIFTGKYVPQIR